jgi:U4/U6.U5 tri-snRNP-associated protein 3
MAEPPQKRARRPDSKQMWEESERRAQIPTRERDEPRDRDRERRKDTDRRDDRDRNRRYRSRSPHDSRGGRNRDRGGRDRDRDGRRDDRDRNNERGEYNAVEQSMTLAFRNSSNACQDSGYGRGGRREEGRGGRDRDSERGEYTAVAHPMALAFRGRSNASQVGGRDSRDTPRDRSRSRDRARDSRKDGRSRSPRKERERDVKSSKDLEKDLPKAAIDEEIVKERTATPPVSFKVGGQDPDRMDVDGAQSKKGKNKNKKEKVEEEFDDDDEIVIEDDGMAAMQAMMGFGGFSTTHQKKVEGNNIGAVRKEKRTEYRQYMNRVGGFNRPLSPSRD